MPIITNQLWINNKQCMVFSLKAFIVTWGQQTPRQLIVTYKQNAGITKMRP